MGTKSFGCFSLKSSLEGSYQFKFREDEEDLLSNVKKELEDATFYKQLLE